MCYDTTGVFHTVIRYHRRMTDDNGRDLSTYPTPGTAEIGILKFGEASASGRAEPAPRPALNPEATRAVPLVKAAEYAPTPTERIADALERIASALESRPGS